MYTIEITKHNYNLIYKFITSYKNYYQTKINLLKNKYIESLKNNDYITLDKILTEKRNLEIKIIKEIIKLIEIDKDSYIFIHGSYAKKMNRWHSDIDINILYKKDNRLDNIKTEELLSVMLYKIFRLKGRDKIHSMMIYTKPKFKICPIITDNKYRLQFLNNKMINYSCRKNYEHIYPTIINTSRDITDYKDYLNKSSKCDYYEWLYSYYVLDNRKEIYNIINNLDKKILSSKDFINKLLLKIEQLKNIPDNQVYNKSKISISKLNKILKIKNMNKIYTLLTIIRLFLILQEQKIDNLDFDKIITSKFLESILGTKLLKELEINIKKYMLFLSRIEYLMELNKLNFSSREEKNILVSNLVKKYKNIYSSSIKDDYNNVYSKLNNTMNKTLIKIERKILNG